MKKGSKLSEETKRKISETNKARGIGNWMKGRSMPEETKAKLRDNHPRHWLGKKRGTYPDEWRKNISDGIKKLNRIGKNHHRWVEDKKHPFRQAIRELAQYIKWRSDCMVRDKFTCVLCQQIGGKLEVDHYPTRFSVILERNEIKSFEEAIVCMELWNTENGRTLCKQCHFDHTWGRRKS